jgi:hypothetical protein
MKKKRRIFALDIDTVNADFNGHNSSVLSAVLVSNEQIPVQYFLDLLLHLLRFVSIKGAYIHACQFFL